MYNEETIEEIRKQTNFSDDRILILDKGDNNIHIYKQGPFGFWKIRYEHGDVPSYLRGEYGSFERAKEAVLGYLKAKDINVKQIID